MTEENNNLQNNNCNQCNDKRKFKLYSPFLHVPKGLICVTENLFSGKIDIVKEGLKLTNPFNARTFMPGDGVHIPVDYTKKKYKSKDGYEIIVDTAIVYTITDHKKFYIERDTLKQLDIKMSSLLRRIISKHNQKSISELRIDLKNCGDECTEIKTEVNEFNETYGLLVEDIAIQNVEFSDELRQSLEEDTLVDAQNSRNLKTAETSRRIAELKAEGNRLKGEAEAAILAAKVQGILQTVGNATPEQLKIIRYLLDDNSRVTVLENNGNDSGIMQLAQLLSAVKNSSNEIVNEQKKK